jgi:hypothetical protein
MQPPVPLHSLLQVFQRGIQSGQHHVCPGVQLQGPADAVTSGTTRLSIRTPSRSSVEIMRSSFLIECSRRSRLAGATTANTSRQWSRRPGG